MLGEGSSKDQAKTSPCLAEPCCSRTSEVEGEEMVHQEAAVRPGVPQQREFTLEKKKQKN